MANGQPYDTQAFTCAHKTLPLESVVLVSTLDGRVRVRLVVTDRGPYIPGRDLDVSQAAARVLRFEDRGVAVLMVEVLRGAA
jgi:rare lipoprotein A